MQLIGKELTSFAPLDEFFCITHGRGLVETRSIGLTDQVFRCRVVAAFTTMNLNQEWKTF
jgi:hypothetical protein